MTNDPGRLHRFIDFILREWKQFTIKASLIAAASLYLLQYLAPVLQIKAAWVTSALFASAVASMFLLMEIHRKLHERSQASEFNSLRDAERDLFEYVEQLSRGRRRIVKIDILANRLSRMTPILSHIIQMGRDDQLGSARVDVTVFYSDPTSNGTLELLSTAGTNGGNQKHQSYSQSLDNAVSSILHEAQECKGVEIKFVQYNQLPSFYAIFINRHRLYWGSFLWNSGISDWTGPSNTCFMAQKGGDQHSSMIDWVENRLTVFQDFNVNVTDSKNKASD